MRRKLFKQKKENLNVKAQYTFLSLIIKSQTDIVCENTQIQHSYVDTYVPNVSTYVGRRTETLTPLVIKGWGLAHVLFFDYFLILSGGKSLQYILQTYLDLHGRQKLKLKLKTLIVWWKQMDPMEWIISTPICPGENIIWYFN